MIAKLEMKNRLDLSKFKTSSAGTTVDSPISQMKAQMSYSSLSWFFITFFGTTRIPEKIVFTCLKTNEVFEEITDKKLIEYYITFRAK